LIAQNISYIFTVPIQNPLLLQEKGDEFESTSMYFEAGLKFLHVASLCETPNVDSSKQGDSASYETVF